MACIRVCRIFAQIIATIFLLIGIMGTVIAILTPSWQTVHIEEYGELHHHGLWRDCVIAEKDGEKTHRCTYKFNKNLDTAAVAHADHNHHKSLHVSLPWHTSVLALMVSAGLIGLLALLFSFCAPWVKACALIWSCLCLVSSICCSAGSLIYFISSHDVDYLYIYADTQSYEQESGYSFWCACGASVSLLIAAIFSILTTVLLYVGKTEDTRNTKYADLTNHRPKIAYLNTNV